jgi:hypothetical protein
MMGRKASALRGMPAGKNSGFRKVRWDFYEWMTMRGKGMGPSAGAYTSHRSSFAAYRVDICFLLRDKRIKSRIAQETITCQSRYSRRIVLPDCPPLPSFSYSRNNPRSSSILTSDERFLVKTREWRSVTLTSGCFNEYRQARAVARNEL